ncbi:MAG: carboxymuconolactone decarboxylase family protein [Actinomycetota bacterium]
MIDLPDPLPADDARLDHGRTVLDAVDGDAGERIIESLAEIAPDLGRYVMEFAYGDVYSRPGLKPDQRQLVTLGALTALGGCETELNVHINAALNVGLSPKEIIETFIHSVGYCGFPRALNAVFVARSVFEERGLLPVD